jgi:peptidyl-prolyl cis-trans isomerase B (cyclophilin B)
MITLLTAVLLLMADPAAGTATPPAATSPTPTTAAKTSAKTKERAMQQIQAQIDAAKIDRNDPNWKLKLPKPTVAAFDAAHTYTATMSTNQGDMVIALDPVAAPMHVTSFIYLAKLGFFDGLTFHRVISRFMAQGGDPLGNGRGGPGYQFDGEFRSGRAFDKPGLLAQANAGPGTDGSQFFITFVPTPHLNGLHTIFGQVTKGMDVLDKLESKGTPSGRTTEPLLLQKVTIDVQ